MDYWLDIRLKIRDFFKRHKKKIFIAIVIWGMVISVNYFLKNMKPADVKPQTTYTPHQPVMDTTGSVPANYREDINVLIGNFVNYCNKKDYEGAYGLLTNEYKGKYMKSIDEFKKYVDSRFKTEKIYNIQNYSNFKDIYVYQIRLLDDILASGTTEGYRYDEEKITVKKEDNELRLALDGYIRSEEIGVRAEDSYLKMNFLRKEIFYDKVKYVVEFTNKTTNYIVLQDNTEVSEVQIQLPNEKRDMVSTNNSNLVIMPSQKKERVLTFEKFAEESDATQILFNAIRVLPEFSGNKNKAKVEKEKAIKLYSLKINIQ